MLVFEHVLLESLEHLTSHVERLWKEARRKKKRPKEIELLLAAIEGSFSRFVKLIPPLKTDRVEAVYRHIWFIRKGIRESKATFIEQNAKDIKEIDIPELREKVATYFRDFSFLPEDLRNEVSPLLESGEHDSAVRKAFLVIKQRAIDKYGMERTLDGEDMINFLFSESGKIMVHKDIKKRKAFRDFASGFFRVFRNEYMHNLAADEQIPTQCALSVALFILQLMKNNRSPALRVKP